MDNQQEKQDISRLSPFEAIRRIADDGSEYWSARDLAKILDYTLWQKFRNVLQKAEIACENSGQAASDHFIHTDKMVSLGSHAKRKIEDVYLSRYAAYLLVQNADPNKPIVALGQQYFAMQTRRQELTDQAIYMDTLPEDQKRLYRRAEMAIQNRQLANAAQQVGVTEARDFAIFQDHGYMGLYGGLKAKDIHARKSLKKGQDILDYMGSDELIANSFRASQTRQKLERE